MKLGVIDILEIVSNNSKGLVIHSVEKQDNLFLITILLDEEYFPIVKIDVNNCKVYVNKFVKLYDNISVNKKKIEEEIKIKTK